MQIYYKILNHCLEGDFGGLLKEVSGVKIKNRCVNKGGFPCIFNWKIDGMFGTPKCFLIEKKTHFLVFATSQHKPLSQK